MRRLTSHYRSRSSRAERARQAGHAADNLCVGSKPGCFSTIQAAVNAARR